MLHSPNGEGICQRLLASTAGVTSPTHYVRFVQAHREDLMVWHVFLANFNGRAVWMSRPVSNFDLELYTDASDLAGFGAFFQGKWSAGPWPDLWKEAGLVRNMLLLELFSVVLAVELWGESFRNLKV